MVVDSELFDTLRKLAATLIEEFDGAMNRVENSNHTADLPGWQDYFWESKSIRKAHLKTIEPVGKNKLWLMHINIFPRFDVDLPVFGLDIVANPKKVSGCFCDYSPLDDLQKANHPFMIMFRTQTKDYEWKKARVMPDWALEIFSEDIVGAGAIKDGPETEQLCNMALELSRFYTMAMDRPAYRKRDINTKEAQNKYCKNQKMNRMLHSSILSMGISEERKNQYVENVLFEEVV
jgi:hypothetical protein